MQCEPASFVVSAIPDDTRTNRGHRDQKAIAPGCRDGNLIRGVKLASVPATSRPNVTFVAVVPGFAYWRLPLPLFPL